MLNQLSMAASNQAHYFYGGLRGKAHYQHGHSAHYVIYRAIKLAASVFVLSILDVDHL